MPGDVLLVRDDETGIATVTVSQPARLNAMTTAMWARLGEIFDAMSGDGDLRCVILRGDGDRSFSAGADISEFEQTRADAEKARFYDTIVRPAMRSVAECAVPVVAAIAGHCRGGGFELAACADIRVAGESASFGVPTARLGLVLNFEDMQRVLDLVGPQNLKEILFEMAVVDARRAYEMGFLNRVVADDAVMSEAEKSAQRIASGAPLVQRWHKRFIAALVEQGDASRVPASLKEEVHLAFDTEDFREGRTAFLEKRPPVFKGR